jgi:hypothetical protein
MAWGHVQDQLVGWGESGMGCGCLPCCRKSHNTQVGCCGMPTNGIGCSSGHLATPQAHNPNYGEAFGR